MKSGVLNTRKEVQLFADQKRVLARIEAELESGGSPLVRMPTGSGKTEVAVALVEKLGSKKALFLVPGRVLLKQTADRFAGYSITARSSWPANTDWPSHVSVMVVTPTTAHNRLNAGLMPDDVEIVIVDEAHHCYTAPNKSPSVVVQLLQKMKLATIGLTATPWSLNDKARFDEVFSKLIEGESYASLVDHGRLADLELLVPADGKQIQSGSTDSTGEYTARGIEDATGDTTVYTERAISLIKRYQDVPPRKWKQTIVYAISVGHAINLANLLAGIGVPTGFVASRGRNDDEEEVDRRVDSNRESAVERFVAGDLRVLVNYAIVKEGFDCGSAEIVVLTRPTASQSLYDQMVGRASRLAEGKDSGIVIDFTSNYLRHGTPGSARRYSLLPRQDWTGAGGDPPMIECDPWPEPKVFQNLSDDDVRPWCGFLSNWQIKVCPTCKGSQGDTCKRCGRFRRWNQFLKRERSDRGKRGNTCSDCRVEERTAWEHEQVKLTAAEEGGGRWLGRHMIQTEKSRKGVSGAGSRYTEITGRGACGIENSNTRGGWNIWRPWMRIDGSYVDLPDATAAHTGRAMDGRSAALESLYDALSDMDLIPLVVDKRRRPRKESQ